MRKIETIEDLKSEINRIVNTKPIESAEYYHLGLFADKNFKFHYTMSSHWVGFTNEKPQMEIRESSLVIPKIIIEHFKSIKQPMFVINNEDDFQFYIEVTGGESIIEKSIVQKYMKHILEPTVNAYLFNKGFVAVDTLPKEKFNRVANPKLRMQILNRDKRRCKICGASPAHQEHVSLQLHHIIPYSKGGLTDDKNLITLCHTCHGALEPETDYSLFENIGTSLFEDVRDKGSYSDRIKQNILANENRRKRLQKEIKKKK